MGTHQGVIETIARGLLIRQGRVLLCRNRKHGYAFLPGGHIEFGETARLALERELMEETGLASKAGPLLLASEHRFTASGKTHHEINLVFRVEHLGAPPSTAKAEPVPTLEEQIEFVWVDLAEIPETDVRPGEVKAWLISGGAVDSEHGPMLTGFE